MDAADDDAKLTWAPGDVPVSRAHADPYFSRADGLAEKRHVFLGGNDLAARMAGARTFAVAELGFGTGLSFLAAWALWRAVAAPGGVLAFTSFELAPLSPATMARAVARWPELAPLSARLGAAWRGPGCHDLGEVVLRVVPGDARASVAAWQGVADAWFLDGFAPQRNPQMWEDALLAAIYRRTVRGGTCASYSAAGAVRRGLAQAGFAVGKRPGFGQKRDMTVGHRPADTEF